MFNNGLNRKKEEKSVDEVKTKAKEENKEESKEEPKKIKNLFADSKNFTFFKNPTNLFKKPSKSIFQNQSSGMFSQEKKKDFFNKTEEAEEEEVAVTKKKPTLKPVEKKESEYEKIYEK